MDFGTEKFNYDHIQIFLIDSVIQYTALVWIHEFIRLSGRSMLPFSAGILAAVLPCFSFDDEAHKHIVEAARNVNNGLMKLIATTAEEQTESSGDHDDILNANIGFVIRPAIIQHRAMILVSNPVFRVKEFIKMVN